MLLTIYLFSSFPIKKYDFTVKNFQYNEMKAQVKSAFFLKTTL